MRLLLNIFLILTLFVGFTSCKKEVPQPEYEFILGRWLYSERYPVPGRDKFQERILEGCEMEFQKKGIVVVTTGEGYIYKARYYVKQSTDPFFNYQLTIDFRAYIDYNSRYASHTIRKKFDGFQNQTVDFRHIERGEYMVNLGEGYRKNDELILLNDLTERVFIKAKE